jgi:hypothetical protein
MKSHVPPKYSSAGLHLVAAFKQALCILRCDDAGGADEGLTVVDPDDIEACSQSMSKPSCSWAVERLETASRPSAARNKAVGNFIVAR